MSKQEENEFERAAAEEGRSGLPGELWGFLKQNKKWWLLPILVILLILGLVVLLSGTGVAPFIYTFF